MGTQLQHSLPCKDQKQCRSSDAMTEYDDKYYCFSCNKCWWKNKRNRRASPRVLQENSTITLPNDLTDVFPARELKWLYDRGLRMSEIDEYKITYSPSFKGIVFPIWGYAGHYDSYYIRQVEPRKEFYIGTKQLFYGQKFYTHGPLVLVEDIPSAIRVNRFLPCCALLTNRVGRNIARLNLNNASAIIMWYDPDKAGKMGMLQDLKLLTQYRTVYKIISEKDPKDHTDEEIKQYLEKYGV